MNSKIDDATQRRLVYVKKLYLHGREHASRQTEFDNLIAIHHLDNVVELLLKCIATQLNISLRKPLNVTFPVLWDDIDKKVSLPSKNEMFRLHELRSNVQHIGSSPFSSEEIQKLEVYVADFIEEATHKAFGIGFSDIFVSLLVQDRVLRKILTIAEKAFEEGDYERCVQHADAAFRRAFRQQMEKIRVPDPCQEIDLSKWKNPDEADNVWNALEVLSGTIHTLIIGINTIDYEKYMHITPHCDWHEPEGTLRCPMSISDFYDVKESTDSDAKGFSKENAVFMLNYATNQILEWQP